MPAQELTFVIRARDAFSRVVASAGASFRGMFRSLASGAAAGAAFGATVSAFRLLAGAGRALVRDWEASARAYAKMSAVLRQTGFAAGITTSQATKLAAALQQQTGASDEATASVIALLAAQRNIRGDNLTRAAAAAIDLAEGMKTSGSEASNVEGAARALAMALADPERGMLRLRRAGIMLETQQQEQIKTFARTGQTGKAQSLILDAVSQAYGGAAEAANKATGALTTLRQTIGDIREAMGTAIATSATFQTAVKRIQETADRLLASGAIELWAARVKERVEAILPAILWAGRAVGFLLDKTAELGAVAGAIAGGASLGDAWAGRKDAAAESRAQAAADLAAQRRQIAAEQAERDRQERAAALRSQATARAARQAAIARGEVAAGPSDAGQEIETVDGETVTIGGRKAGKVPLGISVEGLSANPQKAVEQLQDRLETAKEAARRNLAGALAMEADALAALDRAGAAELANQQGTDALDARAKALETLRAKVAELRAELARRSLPTSTAAVVDSLSMQGSVLDAAKAELDRETARPGPGGAFTRMLRRRAGKGQGDYDNEYLQATAKRLVLQGQVPGLQAESRSMEDSRKLAVKRVTAELAEAMVAAETEALAIERDRATLATSSDAIKAEQDRGAAAVAAAQRAQAAEAARMKALEAAGKKVAEAIAKEMAKSAADAYQAMQKAYADAQIEAIKRRPDPLVETPATARRQQVAEFLDRASADAEAEKQDEHDRRREAMLRQRLARGRRVSSKGMEFLEGRANLANAEALAQQNAADLKAAEEARDALARDGNGILREIRDYLRGNLEAS